jgi:drug/metabolite transporter (DMT)-like permease
MGRLAAFAALLGFGAAWGLSMPLIRVAVSTGYRPLGLIVWQQAIMLVLLVPLLRATGQPLPRIRGNLALFLVVAAFGSVLPGYFTFLTAVDLPAGIRSIIVALVPMFVLPMALVAGFERPDAWRLLGVLLGGASMVLICLPGARVTGSVGLGVILLAMISPLCYGVEANYLAWRGNGGLHPFQLLFGVAAIGLVLSAPLAAASGQLSWPRGLGAAEWALLGAGALNVLAYSGYVWVVAEAGSVFASQIAYLVTGFGVVWSSVLLGERYSPLVWAAFAVMLAAIALVQPRSRRPQRST